MNPIVDNIRDAWLAMSWLEIVAVTLGLMYLLLAMRQSLWCWYAAFGSTAIFSWLFWDVSLLMESALNVYYLAMAIYGWWVWQQVNHDQTDNPSQVPIQSWGAGRHALVLAAVAIMTVCSGYLLSQHTQAASPYLDSFTTWGAVITTWMVARKILENWLYWLVIDSAAIFLYIDRGLYLTALLMLMYVVLAVMGWFMWQSEYRQQQNRSPQEDHWQQA
jgi:nicotinamide mononucleotide transporter